MKPTPGKKTGQKKFHLFLTVFCLLSFFLTFDFCFGDKTVPTEQVPISEKKNLLNAPESEQTTLKNFETSQLQIRSSSKLSSGITWEKNLQTAFEKAKAEQRFVYLYFYGQDILNPPSQDQGYLSQPELIQTLTDYYICVKVNYNMNPSLSEKYGVGSLPTHLLLSADGKMQHRRNGKITDEKLLIILKKYAENRLSADKSRLVKDNPINNNSNSDILNSGKQNSEQSDSQSRMNPELSTIFDEVSAEIALNSSNSTLDSTLDGFPVNPVSESSADSISGFPIDLPQDHSLSDDNISNNVLENNVLENTIPENSLTETTEENTNNLKNAFPDIFGSPEEELPKIEKHSETELPVSNDFSNAPSNDLLNNQSNDSSNSCLDADGINNLSNANDTDLSEPSSVSEKYESEYSADNQGNIIPPFQITNPTESTNIELPNAVLPNKDLSNTEKKANFLEGQNNDEKLAVRNENNQPLISERKIISKKPSLKPVLFDGYCPVALSQKHSWIKGSSLFSYTSDQYTLFFSTEDAYLEFQKNPEQYLPFENGLDIILLRQEGKKVQGNRKFGVWFQNQMFLFSSQESRNIFAASPETYLSTKNADTAQKTNSPQISVLR